VCGLTRTCGDVSDALDGNAVGCEGDSGAGRAPIQTA
jgi:hypothetical protein